MSHLLSLYPHSATHSSELYEWDQQGTMTALYSSFVFLVGIIVTYNLKMVSIHLFI